MLNQMEDQIIRHMYIEFFQKMIKMKPEVTNFNNKADNKANNKVDNKANKIIKITKNNNNKFNLFLKANKAKLNKMNNNHK